MKEATGELNMTVIAVVAIAAVGAFFYAFIWPRIKSTVSSQSICSNGQNYVAGTTGTKDYVKCGSVNANGQYSCEYYEENNGKLEKKTVTCKTK